MPSARINFQFDNDNCEGTGMERGTHGERVRLRPRETLALLGFREVADQFDLVQPIWVL